MLKARVFELVDSHSTTDLEIDVDPEDCVIATNEQGYLFVKEVSDDEKTVSVVLAVPGRLVARLWDPDKVTDAR